MKKLIVASLIVGFIVPSFAHAQTVDTSACNGDMTDNNQARMCLIALMNEVIVLTNQLIALNAQQVAQTPPPQPAPQPTPQPAPQPDIPPTTTLTAAPQPTCSLTVTRGDGDRDAIFNWTTQGVDPSAQGAILVGEWFGRNPNTMTFEYASSLGGVPTTHQFVNSDGSLNSRDAYVFGASSYKLQFGATSCVVVNPFCTHGEGDPRLAAMGISDQCAVGN